MEGYSVFMNWEDTFVRMSISPQVIHRINVTPKVLMTIIIDIQKQSQNLQRASTTQWDFTESFSKLRFLSFR